jgi:hypothetical protein
MESSRAAAKEALKDTLGRLEKLVPNQALVDERLTLNAVTPHPQVFGTTFGREVSAPKGLALGRRNSVNDTQCHTPRTRTPARLAVVL